MNRRDPDLWRSTALARAAADMQFGTAGHDILFVLFKWLPQMAVIVFLSLVLGFGYLILVRGDLFQADAKLYVRVGVDQTPSPLLGSDRNVTFLAQTRGAVQSEMDLLRNEVLVQRLIGELGLAGPEVRPEPVGFVRGLKRRAVDAYGAVKDWLDAALIAIGLKTPLSREAAIRQLFAQSLILDNAPGSDIISVSLRWPDEAQAVALLDHFLQIYTNFRSSVFQGSGETDFLTSKRDAAKAAVEAVEGEMAAFERVHDIRNAASRAPLLEADLVDAQRAFERNALDLILARRRLERLGQGLGGGTGQREAVGLGTFPPNSPALGMAATMTALLGERERLLVNNTVEAPEVKEVEAKIAALTVVLRRQLEAEVQDLIRTESTARERFEKVEAALRDLQSSSAGWKSLERRRELAETRYRDTEKRLGEARDISALRNARLSNIVVVQPAAPEGVPIGLRKLSMLCIIAFCALILSGGWALAREIFDGRLYRGEVAARQLGLPLIGEVPECRGMLSAWARRRSAGHATGAALDSLVVKLDERLKAGGHTTLAVIGAAPCEGVSTLALALAAGIGRRRARRVCLVTALSESAALAHMRELELSPRPMPDPTPLSDIRVMEAGEHLVLVGVSHTSVAAGFLDQDSRAAPGLHDGVDLVMFDLPPVRADAEAGVIAGRADATLLVVAAGRLGAAHHIACIESLHWHGASLIGMVLNRTRRFVPGWLGGAR